VVGSLSVQNLKPEHVFRLVFPSSKLNKVLAADLPCELTVQNIGLSAFYQFTIQITKKYRL